MEADRFDRYTKEKNGWFSKRPPSLEVKEFLNLLGGYRSLIVLDLGSGSCSDTEFLKHKGIKALSVDIEGTPNILADLREPLPFLSNSIDGVFCRGVFHILSCKNQIGAIKEIHRVLKLGGVAYLTFEISIFIEEEHQLVLVEYNFGVRLKELFIGRWRVGKRVDHGDHSHYFGVFRGRKNYEL